MKEKIQNFLNKINKDYLIIFLISLILAIPMLSSKLDVYADDGIQHIARAFGSYETLKETSSSKVISSFTNEYGYSWDLFYGPLTTYGIILCKLIMKTWMNGYKLFTYISLLISGIFMYKFIYKLTENNKTGLLSGCLYMLFPYHLTDLYIRNAVGEFVSFAFIPLVFLGVYNLFNNKENNYYLAIGAIGLILTHNLSTMIVAIFSIIYVLINIKQLKDKFVLKSLLINVIFIILITAFYWMPLLETKMFTEYRVYEKNSMSSLEQIESQALKIRKLFATPTEERVVFELGPHMIIMAVFSIMTLKKMSENKKEYIFFLTSALVSLWMSTKYFPWKILPNSFYIIQFPWRMIQMSGFFLCIICSINMEKVIKKYNIKDTIIIIAISLVYVISLQGYIPYVQDEIPEIDKYKLGEMSGREYEVVAGTAKAEYLPQKAYENRFYIASREDSIYTLKGKAVIENEVKVGSTLKARITVLEDNTIFELPYIYYPGYEIRLDGIICKNIVETENGFLGLNLNKDLTVELEVKYKGTNLMHISNLISTISIIVFSVYVWKKR